MESKSMTEGDARSPKKPLEDAQITSKEFRILRNFLNTKQGDRHIDRLNFQKDLKLYSVEHPRIMVKLFKEYYNRPEDLKEELKDQIEGVEIPEDTKTEEIPLVSVPLKPPHNVECPHCGHLRLVEPDADYEVECEVCGGKYELCSFI